MLEVLLWSEANGKITKQVQDKEKAGRGALAAITGKTGTEGHTKVAPGQPPQAAQDSAVRSALR